MTDDQKQFRESIKQAIPDEDILRDFLDLMDDHAIYVDHRGYIHLSFDAQTELEKERGKEQYLQ